MPCVYNATLFTWDAVTPHSGSMAALDNYSYDLVLQIALGFRYKWWKSLEFVLAVVMDVVVVPVVKVRILLEGLKLWARMGFLTENPGWELRY
ncbi:hypothetical protein BELL_0462g00060 [Botrytis elliptica]|uniref:Uncharacterized protein n=1 Tax=Botrytis elliptica TaxID=278938 RepID=A0A4Z1JF13_9HELO|nr:hypothetical protein BELL_0462g00060 [Botrytis elliptica]